MAKHKKETAARDNGLRDYYDRTSTLDAGARIRRAAVSFPKPRRLVALRLEEETLAAIRRLAAHKGINFSTLMRMWITERLRTEKR